jgi:hypothetical protein
MNDSLNHQTFPFVKRTDVKLLLKLQKRWPSCVAWLAFGVSQVGAWAQSADSTVTTGGQITATTCKLFVGDSAGTSFANATSVMDLGKTAATSGTSQQGVGTGQLSGTSTVLFFLGNPGETTPNLSSGCTSLGTGKWDISLQLKSSQILTRSDGPTVVKNSIAAPQGTDATVALFGASAIDSSSATPSFLQRPLFTLPGISQGTPLVGDAGPTANLLAGGTGVTKTGKIWLTA